KYSEVKKGTLGLSGGKDKLAVIRASGDINRVEGSMFSPISGIIAETFIEKIRKVRDSRKYKAVIIRIDSPGVNALASDLMWKEIKLLAEYKHVVASMVDVAASGGYYMEVAADAIGGVPYSHPAGMFIFNIQGEEIGKSASSYTTHIESSHAALSSLWDNVVLAYEAVWATGTGKVASPVQAQVALACREDAVLCRIEITRSALQYPRRSTKIHLIVVGIVRTKFDYIDLGSLAVRTAFVENMTSGLHIVVGKKALGFETNGRDIEKNGRDIEYNGRDIEKNDLGIETFGRGIETYGRMTALRVMGSSN
ncbi:serine protease SPPA, chloroplastic, partial [Tanacetum coccineum]